MRLRQLPVWLAGAVCLLGALLLVVLFEGGARAGMPKFSGGDQRVENIAITGQAKKPSRLHITRDGLAMVRHFEGFPNGGCPYWDRWGLVWTRGYGRTEGIGSGSPCITEPQAARELRSLLAGPYEEAVRKLFRRGGPLFGLFNYHRYSALVSAAYNLGTGVATCFYRSLCEAIRSRNIRAIGDSLLLYSRSVTGDRLPGLVRRREAERMMFLSRPAPFEAFTRGERHAIRLYDRLRRARRKPARRAELARYMGRRADRIERTARRYVDGWLYHRARVRHDALERRARARTIPHRRTR